MSKLSPQAILDLCWEHVQYAKTPEDIMRIREAGRYAWMEKEMGGLEHVQFAYRNNTPIVPPDHCGHPTQLVKRGFIDGKGWPTKTVTFSSRVKLFKWTDGNHWYATLDGDDVQVGTEYKWNSQTEAIAAAKQYAEQHGLTST